MSSHTDRSRSVQLQYWNSIRNFAGQLSATVVSLQSTLHNQNNMNTVDWNGITSKFTLIGQQLQQISNECNSFDLSVFYEESSSGIISDIPSWMSMRQFSDDQIAFSPIKQFPIPMAHQLITPLISTYNPSIQLRTKQIAEIDQMQKDHILKGKQLLSQQLNKNEFDKDDLIELNRRLNCFIFAVTDLQSLISANSKHFKSLTHSHMHTSHSRVSQSYRISDNVTDQMTNHMKTSEDHTMIALRFMQTGR